MWVVAARKIVQHDPIPRDVHLKIFTAREATVHLITQSLAIVARTA